MLWLAQKGTPCHLDDIRILLLFEPGLAEVSLQLLESRNLVSWENGLIAITAEGRRVLEIPKKEA